MDRSPSRWWDSDFAPVTRIVDTSNKEMGHNQEDKVSSPHPDEVFSLRSALPFSLCQCQGFFGVAATTRLIKMRQIEIRYVVLIVFCLLYGQRSSFHIGEVYAQSVYPVISHFLSSFSKLMNGDLLPPQYSQATYAHELAH